MKDYILGGVADVHMFDGDELFGNAITTLTDSGMNISISAEEIRGGKGAALLGRFFHSTGMTLTLTNATFNLEYLGLSVGATLESGASIMKQEELTVSGNQLTPSKTPVQLTGGCSESTGIKAWIHKVGEEEWMKVPVNEGKIDVTADNGTVYCVKYFYIENSADQITVKSNFVPKTLHLLMDADLYVTGDSACAAQTKAGKITIDVPAFQLSGNQDLTMNMTGAATLNLEGTALAVSDGSASCEGGKYYAKISQFIESASWTDGVTALVAEGGKVVKGADAALYAIYTNKTPLKITANMLGDYVLYCGTEEMTGLTIPSDATVGLATITLKKDTVAIASGNVDIVAG